jgi:hypothetical protein
MRVIAITMRVASNKEGEGGKAMAMVTWQASNSSGNTEGSGDGNEDGGQG